MRDVDREGPDQLAEWHGQMAEWAQELVAWRVRRDMSQPQLAKALVDAGIAEGVGVYADDRLIRRWETGERTPSRTYRALLTILGAPQAPSRPRQGTRSKEVDPMRRRTFLAAVASAVVGAPDELHAWYPPIVGSDPRTGRVGAGDVRRIQAMTAHFRGMAGEFGGASVVDPATAALDSAAGLVGRCDDDSVRTDLHIALGDLANVVGWAHHDSGGQDQALAYLTRGLHWALASGAREGFSLASNLLFGMARVSLQQTDPESALKLAQLGHVPAAEAGDTGSTAKLHSTAAWAYAMMGRGREMTDSLRRAEDDMHTAGGDRMPQPWMQVFFSPGDFAGHQALVYSSLAAHTTDRVLAETSAAKAVALTDVSLAESCGDRPPRSMLFDQIVAAQSRFRVGDVEAGLESAHRVVSGVADIASRRAVERLPEIMVAAARFAHTSTVSDVMRELGQAAAGTYA